MKTVTIIINCKNDFHVLKTIGSVDYPAEIIVALVPNPELKAKIENLGIRVIDAPDNNIGASRQLAIEAASSEICIFTDSDTTFDGGYIKACTKGLEKYDMCRGNIRFLSDPAIEGSSIVAKVRHYFNNIRNPPYTPGLALRRSFALSIGGFDCDICWGVDHEFGERAIAAGGHFCMLPSVWINHLPISYSHDLRAANRIGQAMRKLDNKKGISRKPWQSITNHLFEPYFDIFMNDGYLACRHHFIWVSQFYAGYLQSF